MFPRHLCLKVGFELHEVSYGFMHRFIKTMQIFKDALRVKYQ